MRFGRVLTAMVTPYDHAGEVDYNKAQQLTEYLLTHGSDAVVVCGTTGECPTLTPEEKDKLLAAVVEAAKGKGKVVAGTTDNETAFSINIAKRAEKAGADGLLAVVPYYNKPPQEGLYQHFKVIANSSDLPVVLYNIPGRTGINMLPETVQRLAADCPTIVALKDSTGNLDQLSQLRSIMPADFDIYSGDDSLTLPILSVGGCGVISVASHLIGDGIQEMIQAFFAGDVKKALDLHLKYLPVLKKIFITANPIPIKSCMNLLGWDMGDCRLPLIAANAEQEAVLKEMLQTQGLL